MQRKRDEAGGGADVLKLGGGRAQVEEASLKGVGSSGIEDSLVCPDEGACRSGTVGWPKRRRWLQVGYWWSSL